MIDNFAFNSALVYYISVTAHFKIFFLSHLRWLAFCALCFMQMLYFYFAVGFFK